MDSLRRSRFGTHARAYIESFSKSLRSLFLCAFIRDWLPISSAVVEFQKLASGGLDQGHNSSSNQDLVLLLGKQIFGLMICDNGTIALIATVFVGAASATQ